MIVLKNSTLASGEVVDIVIDAGKITELGKSKESGIDCSGLMALPGLVDLHTHLRQPGFEESETVRSGTRSAAAGGYTAVFAMANTSPVADSPSVVEKILDLSDESLVEVRPIGAVTRGLEGSSLADIRGMANSRAQVRVFSDDGMCVFDTDLMTQALEAVKEFGGVVAQHAQAPELTAGAQMNAGALAVELGLTGWPTAAEVDVIERDIRLAEKLGSRIHICHLTTADAVQVVREAKRRGAPVTAEVTPHHLMLDEELVRSYNPVFKVNPPLRTPRDIAALREGLIDGTIDILATDHAPHSADKKECEWQRAAFGMVGLENAASVLQHVLIESGAADWERFVEVSSSKPAEIGGLKGQGSLEIGGSANLALIDPAARRLIEPHTQSRSTNNPFSSQTLPGAVVHTIYRGEFSVRDGEVQFG